MKVEILSRKLVKPSAPTPHHLRTLETSFIDLRAALALVPLIFYYSGNGDGDDVVKARRDNLERSLAELLVLFYPLAGRFDSDRLIFECNDEGAEYVEAQVSVRLEEFLDRNPETDTLNPFIPSAVGTAHLPTNPLLAIQVNVFSCGGLAITICVSHKIADGFTGTAFINAWAKASRFGVHKVTPPRFEFPSHLPPRPSISPDLPLPMKANPSKMVTKRFIFDGAAVLTLKAKYSENLGQSTPTTVTKRLPSRLEVVSGVIWYALISAAKGKHGQLRDSLFSQSINLRGRTNVEIPKDSMGNCYTLSYAQFQPNITKREVPALTDLVGGAIRTTVQEYAKANTVDQIFSMVKESYDKITEEMCKEDVDVFLTTSLCKFPMYEVDFGWGKPIWVSRVSMTFEIVMMLDTKSGDGIEAWVTLCEEKMIHFQQDPHILAFTSSS